MFYAHPTSVGKIIFFAMVERVPHNDSQSQIFIVFIKKNLFHKQFCFLFLRASDKKVEAAEAPRLFRLKEKS